GADVRDRARSAEDRGIRRARMHGEFWGLNGTNTSKTAQNGETGGAGLYCNQYVVLRGSPTNQGVVGSNPAGRATPKGVVQGQPFFSPTHPGITLFPCRTTRTRSGLTSWRTIFTAVITIIAMTETKRLTTTTTTTRR